MSGFSPAVPWHRRAGVWIGIGTGPGTFIVGGALSAHLPLLSLLLVIPVGAAVLASLTVAQGIVSQRRREASARRAVTAFGPGFASVLLNVIIALGSLGWFGFYAGLAGFAAANLLELPPWAGTVLVVILLYLVYIIGLNRWNSFVWLTAVSTICVAIFALHSAGTRLSPDTVTRLSAGSFVWGAGAVITYGMLFALRVGDFSWDLHTSVDVVKSGLALFIPITAFMLIGAVVYRATGDYNIADVLAKNQSATLGNLFLIISVIAPSMSGFHSAQLVVASSRTGAHLGAVVIALFGLGLGILRFDHELLLFLDVLGAFIAPALVVMLIIALIKKGFSRTGAIVSWLFGSAIALATKYSGDLSPVLVGAAVSIVFFSAWIGVSGLHARAPRS